MVGAVELWDECRERTSLCSPRSSVVIVGGIGSIVGAALVATILGVAEAFGLAYAPTYSVVFTFVVLVLVLTFRPRGIFGRPA